MFMIVHASTSVHYSTCTSVQFVRPHLLITSLLFIITVKLGIKARDETYDSYLQSFLTEKVYCWDFATVIEENLKKVKN